MSCDGSGMGRNHFAQLTQQFDQVTQDRHLGERRVGLQRGEECRERPVEEAPLDHRELTRDEPVAAIGALARCTQEQLEHRDDVLHLVRPPAVLTVDDVEDVDRLVETQREAACAAASGEFHPVPVLEGVQADHSVAFQRTAKGQKVQEERLARA